MESGRRVGISPSSLPSTPFLLPTFPLLLSFEPDSSFVSPQRAREIMKGGGGEERKERRKKKSKRKWKRRGIRKINFGRFTGKKRKGGRKGLKIYIYIYAYSSYRISGYRRISSNGNKVWSIDERLALGNAAREFAEARHAVLGMVDQPPWKRDGASCGQR